MGLLPVRGDTPRTANIICIPQHDIWALKTAAEVKDFLHKSFPQLTLEDAVSDDVPITYLPIIFAPYCYCYYCLINHMLPHSVVVHRHPLQLVICYPMARYQLLLPHLDTTTTTTTNLLKN